MPSLRLALRSAGVSLIRPLASITRSLFFAVPALWLAVVPATPQSPVPGPNSDPTYQALRNLTLSGEAVSVNNLDLKRDAGTFHLHSGTVCLSLIHI